MENSPGRQWRKDTSDLDGAANDGVTRNQQVSLKTAPATPGAKIPRRSPRLSSAPQLLDQMIKQETGASVRIVVFPLRFLRVAGYGVEVFFDVPFKKEKKLFFDRSLCFALK